MNNSFATLFITLIIFLALREVVTWYWKMNATVKLLTDLLAELKKTNALLSKTEEPIESEPELPKGPIKLF